MSALDKRRCPECNALLERHEGESLTNWRSRIYCNRVCHRKKLKRQQWRAQQQKENARGHSRR